MVQQREQLRLPPEARKASGFLRQRRAAP
jgi:hypothetical protein